MAKLRLTKGELKRQRDNLAQFQHYLPTLQLKKQQIQQEIARVHAKLDEQLSKIERAKDEIGVWGVWGMR